MTAKAEYAVRAAIELAASEEGALKRDEIAQLQSIPVKFLENILSELRNAGLLHSQRGSVGGYRLARPADQITVADVVRAVDGPLASVHGERPEDLSYAGNAEPLQLVWVALRTNIRAVLEGVTLADLAGAELPEPVLELTTSPEDWLSGTALTQASTGPPPARRGGRAHRGARRSGRPGRGSR